eukprot:258684-Rhodomonas_salina.1
MHDADAAGNFEGEDPEEDDDVPFEPSPPGSRAQAQPTRDRPAEHTSPSSISIGGVTGSAEPEPVNTVRRSARVRDRLMKPSQLAVAASTTPDSAATPVIRTPPVQSPLAYGQWTAGAQIPPSASLTLLTDLQLAKALVHHEYVLTLPADWWIHPDTQRPTACSVRAVQYEKLK